MEKAPREKDGDYARTSLCDRSERHPDEVTVRLRRWTAWRDTAYQKGQYAGFLRHDAEEFVRRRVADPVVAFHLARLRAGERSAVIVMTEK